KRPFRPESFPRNAAAGYTASPKCGLPASGSAARSDECLRTATPLARVIRAKRIHIRRSELSAGLDTLRKRLRAVATGRAQGFAAPPAPVPASGRLPLAGGCTCVPTQFPAAVCRRQPSGPRAAECETLPRSRGDGTSLLRWNAQRNSGFAERSALET